MLEGGEEAANRFEDAGLQKDLNLPSPQIACFTVLPTFIGSFKGKPGELQSHLKLVLK